MSKFASALAELLYLGVCDETQGDSSEGPAWYGLCVGDLLSGPGGAFDVDMDEAREEAEGKAAAIVCEDHDGSVSVETFDTEQEARERWAEIADELEGSD